jgi:hypothetical protein
MMRALLLGALFAFALALANSSSAGEGTLVGEVMIIAGTMLAGMAPVGIVADNRALCRAT